MQFLANDRPFGLFGLVNVHRPIIADCILGVRRSPDVGGEFFLNFQGQSATGKVAVRMALGIAVILRVDQHPALAVIFVGMMFRMAHFPVQGVVRFSPLLFGNAPALQHIAGAQAQTDAQLSLLAGDFRDQFQQKARIALIVLIPGDALIFFGFENFFEISFVKKLFEIALQLAVVAPDSQIVGQVHADHAGLHRGFASKTAGKIFKKQGAEQEPHAGILARCANPVFAGNLGHVEYGVAPDGTGGAAVAPDGAVPGLRS